MSRYIDAEEALDTIRDNYCDYCDHLEECRWCETNECIIAIKETATADVVEVKHGRWIPQMIPTGVSAFGVDEMTCEVEKCSWCESEYWVGEEKLFCPHCGADMRGDKYE